MELGKYVEKRAMEILLSELVYSRKRIAELQAEKEFWMAKVREVEKDGKTEPCHKKEEDPEDSEE